MLLNCTHKGRAGQQQQPGPGQEDQHRSGFSFHEQEDDSRQEAGGGLQRLLDTSHASEALLLELALISRS